MFQTINLRKCREKITMAALTKTTETLFGDRLTKIEQALNQGNLVTSDLEVVEKNGIKWAWIRFSRAFLKVFSCCQDPWKAYRINAVAQALSTFTSNNQAHLTPDVKQRLEQILAKLEVKAGHSTKHQKVYLEALKSCRINFEKPAVSQPQPQQNNVPQAVNAASKPQNKVPQTIPQPQQNKGPQGINAASKPQLHQQQVRKAINILAGELCLRIAERQDQKSFSISPVSILATLGMCLHAINADKKELFLGTIGLSGLSEMEAHVAISQTLKDMTLPKDFKHGIIDIAQGFARKKGTVVGDSLIKLVKETYKADIIDSDDSDNLVDKVNQWVATKTHDKIPEILSDNDASLVLLNAIYLTLQWETKFKKPKDGWQVEEFICRDGSKARVSMMKQKGNFNIYQGHNFKMLEKPYLSPDGRTLSQLIFLPNDPQDLDDLQIVTLQKYRKEAQLHHDVILSMPKTKADNTQPLLELLAELGLPLDCLDEKVISTEDNMMNFIHRTFVFTDEDGTEAAAVTAIGLAGSMPHEPPEEFNINHSYAYLIMDGDTVLFRGRVCDQDPLVMD